MNVTPQEKAGELYSIYKDEMLEADAYFTECGTYSVSIMTCDYIIDNCEKKNVPYWEEVKQELIKKQQEFFKFKV